jgi:hypothetical protein
MPAAATYHLAQRPERDALAVRQATTEHEPRTGAHAVHQFADEPRLADAGVGDDGDQMGPARSDDGFPRRPQGAEFRIAADNRGIDPSLVAIEAGGADDSVRLDRLRLALQRQRFDFLRLDGVPHQLVRDRADVDFVRRCRGFEPRGDVDRIPGRELLIRRRIVERNHLSGVDAGACRERHAKALLERGVQLVQRVAHAHGGTHRTQRVVLVRARQAEDRHDRVADVLLDLAAVARDLLRHRREVALLHFVKRLAVQPLAQGGGILEVGKHERHGLADLVRRQRCGDNRCQRRAAITAKTELRRIFLAAGGTFHHSPWLRIQKGSNIAGLCLGVPPPRIPTRRCAMSVVRTGNRPTSGYSGGRWMRAALAAKVVS